MDERSILVNLEQIKVIINEYINFKPGYVLKAEDLKWLHFIMEKLDDSINDIRWSDKRPIKRNTPCSSSRDKDDIKGKPEEKVKKSNPSKTPDGIMSEFIKFLYETYGHSMSELSGVAADIGVRPCDLHNLVLRWMDIKDAYTEATQAKDVDTIHVCDDLMDSLMVSYKKVIERLSGFMSDKQREPLNRTTKKQNCIGGTRSTRRRIRVYFID